jgi:hypothetical protein
MPSYPVQLAIHTLPALTVEVVASAGEPWALLGRDVMNAYRMLLEGPQSFVEIT